MKAQKFSVLVADAQAIVRYAICALLKHDGIDSYMAANSEEVLTMNACLRPEIILLDPQLPELSMQEIIYALDKAKSPAKILLLSQKSDMEQVYRLSTSIVGCVKKTERPAALITTVRNALALPEINDWNPVAPRLTPAERRVLGLAATGATNTNIASQLIMSPATVSAHMQHLRAKLGAKSKVQAVLYALSGRLLE